MSGTKVTHPIWGHGVEVGQKCNGYQRLVRFDTGELRWARFDALTILEKSKAELPPPISASVVTDHSTTKHTRSSTRDSERFSSRRLVEALRHGIVPDASMGEFTFGRDQEVALLNSWLESTQHNHITIVGRYGSGKSHLLNYVRHLALRAGYATATVSLDLNETLMSKPKRVFRAVVQSATAHDTDHNVLDFRQLIEMSLKNGHLKDHKYYGQLLGRTEDEFIWNWIGARDPAASPRTSVYEYGDQYRYLPILLDTQTAANVYCNMLSALSWAVARSGYKGLLLLFDECECIDALSGYTRDTAVNFLLAIVRTAANDERLLRTPAATGLNWACRAADVPFLWKSPCRMKILFASTDCYLARSISGQHIELNPLSRGDLDRIFEHIVRHYRIAYAWSCGDGFVREWKQIIQARGNSARSFVKSAVESLDLARFGKHLPQKESRRSWANLWADNVG